MSTQSSTINFPPKRSKRESPLSKGQVISGVVIVFAIIFAIALATSGVTELEAGRLGVVVNNITGDVSTVVEPGYILHLPLGLTDVYVLDATLQNFDMGGSAGADSGVIKIKSRDGSDVFIDASVTFSIDKLKGEEIARQIGTEDEMISDMLIAYTRSILRDELGKVHIEDVIDAESRNAAVNAFKTEVEKKADRFGIEINTIAAQNPSFNPEYERLIGDRKSADQQFANQASAQERARSNQQLAIAEATRLKEIAVREEEGKQRRRVIEAETQAQEKLRRAEGEAYRVRLDGERQRDIALREADAVRSEGLKKAEGIRALAEAYAEGGLGLVREALAAKYIGTRIDGRPYSLDSTVERLSIESAGAGAIAAPSPKAD
jgi:regulator of protease activity HflC (stomatin/prohibitin superfamily)